MKKLLFILLGFPITALAQVDGFTITGKITGLADGSEVKLISGGNVQTEIAKTTVSKGSFYTFGKGE